MHEKYLRHEEGKNKGSRWKWLRKINLKGCTEALICSAQEQALKTNYMKFHIDKTAESLQYKMCRVENETVSHIVSECKILAQ